MVLRGGENDAGPGAVADLADVTATFPDEELVVFWLRTQLGRVALRLLKGKTKSVRWRTKQISFIFVLLQGLYRRGYKRQSYKLMEKSCHPLTNFGF